MLRRIPTLLSLMLGSCTLALGFPEPGLEGASAATCANSEDDDLDGRVDCADPDCDGRCEEEAERCSDGRDNDGDGRLDGLDPACWTEASIQITRCAGIDGTTSTLESGATFGWRGSADRIAQSGREYFGATTAPARIAWATPLTGRLDDSRFDVTVSRPAAVRAAVWLVPASAIDLDLTIAPDTDRIGLDFGPDTARLFARFEYAAYVVDPRMTGDEVRLGVSFDAENVDLALRVGDVDVGLVRAALPVQWGPDEPVVVLFEADASPEPVLLRDVVVARPDRMRCDRRVPELIAEGENVVLDASRDTAGRRCVLTTIEPTTSEQRRVRAYASSGDGWTDAGVIETEGLVLGASIAWDEARGEWFGLVAGIDEPSTVDPSLDFVRTLRGLDCGHLVVGEESGFPRVGLEAAGLDYAVLEDGRHRATFDYYGESAGRYGLREAISPDGAPGSWGELSNIDLGDGYDALRRRTDRLSIDTLGRHRLLFVEVEGEVRLYRERSGDWEAWEAPIFAAENEPGTFDASRISPPRLLMDEETSEDGRWRGRLWYGGASGSGCVDCGRAGSADVEVLP